MITTRIILILLFSVTIFFPLSASAAPSISGTSGTWNHGGSVTVSGSGFGTKAIVTPTIWDHGQYATLSAAGWAGGEPSASDCGASANMKYSSTLIDSVVMPHARTTAYMTGSHCGGLGANNGQQVTAYYTFTKANGNVVYVSWYDRISPAWVHGDDDNFKTFGYSIGEGSIYNLPNNWYVDTKFWTNNVDDGVYTINDDSPTSLQNPDVNGHSFWWNTFKNPAVAPASDASKWVKREVEFTIQSATGNNGGYLNLWDNGSQEIAYVGRTDAYSGTTRTLGVGGYARMYPQVANRRYFADIYVDIQPSGSGVPRVLLCQDSTLSSRGICEPQIPTSWSISAVGVTVNAGRFADGNTTYLYVCDSAASCNSTGTPITIASGGGDTTPPTAPTGLSAQ